jgi:hypothetical protein
VARSPALLLLFGVAVAGQEPRARLLAPLDGIAGESLRVEGHASVAAAPGAQGLAALRCAPAPEGRFYGLSLREIRVRDPVAIEVSLRAEGEVPLRVRFRIEVEDEDGRRAGDLEVQVDPGAWARHRIELGGSGPDALPGACRTVNLLRWSRRQASPADAAFWIDHVVLWERTSATVAAELARALAAKDPDSRAREARRLLPLLPDPERAAEALRLLGRETQESVRRAARECGARAWTGEAPELVGRFEAARGPAREEWAWILGASSLPDLQAALGARFAGLSPTEAAALLAGRLHRSPPSARELLRKLPRPLAWPVAAIAVRALREEPTPASIQDLIALLQEAPTARIASDAAHALGAMAGRELGTSAEAWRTWWEADQGRTPLQPVPSIAAEGPYGGFYGIPVRAGRTAFLLDVSGSMRVPLEGAGLAEHLRRSPHLDPSRLRTRFDLAVAELAHALGQLEPPSTFAVLAYNDEVQEITRGFVPAEPRHREEALRKLRRISPSQKTNIHDGLLRAFQPDRTPGPEDWQLGADTIFLLSDGRPSAGPIQRSFDLLDAAARWNLGRGIRIHAVNVGDRREHWLAALAAESDGVLVEFAASPGPDRSPPP